MKNEFIKRNKAKSGKKRRFCIILALLMIFGTIIPVLPAMSVSAADADEEKQSRIAEVKEILNAVHYVEYLKEKSDLYFKENGVMPYGSGEIVITPAKLNNDPELTTAEGITTSEQMGKQAIYLPEKGAASFNFTVEKEGLYNLEITYLQVVGKTSAIERMIKIDDKVPSKKPAT